MQNYTTKKINEIDYKNNYLSELERKRELGYSRSLRFPSIIEELQSAHTRVSDLEDKIYLTKDCGSCPNCACINADFQVLAVIEAPATVPLLVMVGGIRLTS